MNLKMFRILTGGIFVATLGVASVIGCSSGVNPQSTPTCTTTKTPTSALPASTATTSLDDEIQTQLNDTIQRFFELNEKSALNSPESEGLFSGELTDWDTPTIGEIKGNANSIIFLDSSNAVTRVQIDNGYLFDAYLYLSYDSVWKFIAIRAMVLPGFVIECLKT